MATLHEVEDADNSDPHDLSGKLKVKAELSFAADGASSLGNDLGMNCVGDDDAEGDCKFVDTPTGMCGELYAAIESASVSDEADRSGGIIEEERWTGKSRWNQ